MASQSQDRENLLRDATAFVTRVQLQFSRGERSEVVFVGFRTGGAASFYFDQDPVYHFNTTGQLRRAFVDDVLVKAEAGQLVRLHRQRSEHESAMIRDKMTVDEQQAFCQTVTQRLHEFLQMIDERKYVIDGQVQGEGNGAVSESVVDVSESVVNRVREYLEQLGEIQLGKIIVADSPRVAG